MSAFLWAVLTACIWGFVPILEKIGLAKVQPMVGLFYRCLGVVLGVLLLGFFVLKPAEIKNVDMRSVTLLVLAGFLASFAGQLMFYHALKLGDVSKIVPISGAYPFLTFLLGVIILGEAMTPAKIVGVVFVVLGIWFLR